MLQSLKDIFNKITPSNIQNIPLIKYAQQVFIDSIERNSKVAKRITNIFDVQERNEDSDLINNAKKNLKEGLYQTYICILYKYLKSILSDESLRADLKKFGYTDAAIYQDISKIINTEFIQANKIYTEKVGNNSATRYMYAFSKYLESGEIKDDLDIVPESPFITHKEGSLGRRIYREFTQPLSHQIGFVDNYETVFKLNLFDYFGVEIEEGFNRIEVICEDTGYIFIKDSSPNDTIAYLETKINPKTGARFTHDEVIHNFSIFPNKNILTWRKYRDSNEHLIMVFVFTDQTVLYHDYTSPRKTYFTKYEDYLNGFKNPILDLGDCYKLTFDKTNNFKFLYTDNANFEKDHYVTMIKENNKGAVGQSCYTEVYQNNQFKVDGKEMQYALGASDKVYVTNYDEVKSYKNKFIPSLNTFVPNEGTITISDKFEHSINIDYYSGSERYRVNTLSLYGDEYKIVLTDFIFPDFTLEATGLNNTIRPIKILDFYSELGKITFTGTVNNGTEVKTISDFKTTHSDTYLKVIYKTSKNKIERYLDYSDSLKFKFNFSFDLNDKDTNGELHVYLMKYNTKPVVHEYLKISDLKRYTNIKPCVSVLHYDNPQFVKYNLQTLDKPSKHPDFNEFTPNVHARIGQKVDGSFYGALLSLRDYPRQEWSKFDDIKYTGFADGILLCPEKKTYDFRNYEGEEVFINIGFRKVCIDTSDMIIMTSPYFVNDGDFDMDGDDDHNDGGLDFDVKYNGYYFFSEFEPTKNGSCYFFTKDKDYFYGKVKDTEFKTITITAIIYQATGTEFVSIYGKKNFGYVKNLLGIPLRDGYTFKNWSFNPDLEQNDPIPDDFVFTTNTRVYAKYTKNA